MRACLRGAGILSAVLLILPLLAADDAKDAKKKDDAKPAAQADKAKPDAKDAKKSDKTAKKDDKDKKAEKKEKFVWGASFTGKLKEMDANSQKEFTVEVQIQVPNPQGIQDYINAQAGWQRHKVEIIQAQRNNPVEMARQLAQYNQDIARALPNHLANTVKSHPLDVKVRAADNIRVRTWGPPLDYDEKGNVKKYTKKELKELKGPENLPGYKAEYEALHAGQVVTVYLARKEPNPVPKSAKPLTGKFDPKAGKAPAIKLDDDKTAAKTDKAGKAGIKLNQDDPQAAEARRPEVVMIVIMAEPKER
jgi:hypothetical protein